MKKLITAIALLAAPIISNAAFIEVSEQHQVVGDTNPFRIMWNDFDSLVELRTPSLNVRNYTERFQGAFYGINENGSLSDEIVFEFHGFYTFFPAFAGFGPNFPLMFDSYIGMELVLDYADIERSISLNAEPIDDDEINLLTQPENVRTFCSNIECDSTYNLYFPTHTDINDIAVLANNFNVTYTYDDSKRGNANVPEPATTALLGLALAGGFIARRKKKV